MYLNEGRMAEIFVESLYDAVVDCLKVVPILFLAYLLVSYLSHDHSHKFSKFLSKKNKTSVFYASFLGCVPQCGFSSVLADLYSRRQVSLGTLVAVLIATSDEAIPIMLTNSSKIVDMLILIAIKVALAIFWGYLIDGCVALFRKRKKVVNQPQEQHEEHHHEEHEMHMHTHECGHIHSDECDENCEHSHGSCCVNNVFLDAFLHTFNIVIYIFVATFIINMIVNCCDMEAIKVFLETNEYLQVILASLVGLIPNCASSVLLVELYVLYGTLSFPALIAGLTAGAGVGLVILFTRNKKHPLENIGILLLQLSIGIASGMFLTLFF